MKRSLPPFMLAIAIATLGCETEMLFDADASDPIGIAEEQGGIGSGGGGTGDTGGGTGDTGGGGTGGGGTGDTGGTGGGDTGGTGGGDASRLSLVGDPSFDPSGLSADERVWYDRVLGSMARSAGTVEDRSSNNNTYVLGRYVGDYTAALLMALRATGDLAFLDRVGEISENYRADLADAWLDGTTDGYLNWLWLEASDTYHGNDLHQMDEAMVHGNVALVAYAFHVNRHLDASYAEKADFWIDYLENHFIAKWYERAGDPVDAWETSAGFYKRLMHPRANQQRIAFYLWKLTGDSFYKARADHIADEIRSAMQDNPSYPGAYRWKHQVAGSDEGWQKINYAQYPARVLLDMHFADYDWYADDAEMQHFTVTFRDAVLDRFGSPWSSMVNRVDGSESTGTNVYGLGGFGRWDSTGRILEIADANYDEGSYGLSVAAYSLMVVSQRD